MCGQHKSHKVQYVSDNSSGTNDDYQSEYTYATSLGESVTVMVGGIPVKMHVDSGSTCNTINSTEKACLVKQGLELVSCKRKLHPYNSPPIPVKQFVRTHIKLDDGPEILADLLVVEGTATALLGRETAELTGC